MPNNTVLALRGHSKSIFIEKWRGREVTEKQTKTNRGRGGGFLARVYVHFLKKNTDIFKMKFIVILHFFLLIIMTV